MNVKQKVVVTGGAGFIGSHLVAELLRENFEVQVVDTYAGGKKEERLHKGALYHEIDVSDFDALAPIFADALFVFHTAALPRVQFSIEYPQKTNETNVTGTLNVLLAARDAGVKKVVYSASSSAYGETDIMPLREDMPAHPISPYGLQKYIGELYCRLFSDVYKLPTVSLRYFNVYGPQADPNGAYALVIAKFIRQRLEGDSMTINGDGTQTRDYTHVRDVVRANLLAAQSPAVGKGEVINIGAGSNTSVNKIAELIGGPIEYVAPRMEPHDTLADNSLAKKLLEWEPQESLEEGIAELKKLSGLQ